MGIHRRLHNRRGCLTETVFDAQRGVFTERAFPPPLPPQAVNPKDRHAEASSRQARCVVPCRTTRDAV